MDPPPPKKRLKSWIRQIHLWLGLASGLIVCIVSVTGCLYVFQNEISDITYRKTFFISPRISAALPISVLQQKAQFALGTSMPVNFITTYRQPNKAWEFMAYQINDSSLTYFGAINYFKSVYLNPYDGNITGFRDYKYDFFNIVKYIHWSLLLNTKYGQPIVGWATLLFVILLLSGLVLWWPKKWNKKNIQQSFTIKKATKWKRFNYDLHNVLGFYSLLLALVLALTGMTWSFSWFRTIENWIVGDTVKPQEEIIHSIPDNYTKQKKPVDLAYYYAYSKYPTADRIAITPAYSKEGPLGISTYRGKEIYYDRDDLQFDQYTGKVLNITLAAQKNKGQQLLEMNYDIHVGAIGGLPGKIIAFIISFICASLPITGFYIWWNKRNKKKLRSSLLNV